MSVEQLLLILPILTSLRQAGLTQTGGSSSCVLPDWRPKVLNRILSCYSFCRNVEELSSGTTLPFPSLHFLSLSFVQCHASWDISCKVWWFFLFFVFFCKPDFLVWPSTQHCFSCAERYPVIGLRVNLFLLARLASWLQACQCLSASSNQSLFVLNFLTISKSITVSSASAVLCG